MTEQEIKQIASSDSFGEAVKKLSKDRTVAIGDKKVSVQDCLDQYDPYKHKVFDKNHRPDKIIDQDGGEIYDAVNDVKRRTTDFETVPVNRLPIPIQKRIVLISATFLIGDRIGIESVADTDTDKLLEKFVRKVWRDNKLDYISKEIAKTMMSETHCAELWYDYPDERYWQGTELSVSKKRFGVKLLAESKGDKLYPVFDEYDDLVAFARGYKVEKTEHFDIYTADKILFGKKEDGQWSYEEKVNHFGAIPVIYYSQPAPEWADVQPLIERKETTYSDFADTNDYFADPALVAEGSVENLASKGEIGKSYQVTNGGKLSYLTWDAAPQAIELEFSQLDKEIYANTHTP